MRTNLSSLSIILLLSTANQISGQETVVQGKVHHWPSDTVYFCELPFHSPHSYTVKTYVFERDSSFRFSIPDKNQAFVFFIAPSEKVVDNQVKSLLLNNLTDQHYWGHCIKVYTHGKSTFLMEPQSLMEIDLTYNSWPEVVSARQAERMKKLGVTLVGENTLLQIGETYIEFKDGNRLMNEYYQKSFDLDDKIDKALERSSSNNLQMAMVNCENTRKELLADLEMNKEILSPVFYDYLEAEIIFGTKKEFLKYLGYTKKDYLQEAFASGKLPYKLLELISLDRSKINETTILSEEYNEYLEFYLNFVMSMANMKNLEYHHFSMDKLILATEELPKISMYYYLANHLLNAEPTVEFSSFCSRLVEIFPDGELNDKLIEKYSIE